MLGESIICSCIVNCRHVVRKSLHSGVKLLFSCGKHALPRVLVWPSCTAKCRHTTRLLLGHHTAELEGRGEREREGEKERGDGKERGRKGGKVSGQEGGGGRRVLKLSTVVTVNTTHTCTFAVAVLHVYE